MSARQVVSAVRWQAARDELLVSEKAATRAGDALAAQRRRLPMVKVDKDYVFEGPNGGASLLDLFEGRRQLLVYHFMWERIGDPSERCEVCSMVVDNICHTAHLNARDATLVLVARAPQAEIAQFKERMGWTVPWYSTFDDFNADHDVPKFFGLNVFLRDGDDVFRTYFTTGRGVEALGSSWSFLDVMPFGRQEDWEDSPEDTPQTAPYGWWSLHDEYAKAAR
ncbi:MAG: hypothetical protein QOG68_699 [Solirubrobacteraceae bacterium]|nr:hypothetical protein [Solirubrobacteraceae bacterium]